MIADDKLTEILVKEANHKKYNVGKWVPTTEEEFDDMLCILPPEKWERFWVISIFRMCEYQTWNITRHYMRNWDEYFTGNFDTKSYDTYEDIIPKL